MPRNIMEIQILLILACLIGTIRCSISAEHAPVSARERSQGYSCKSRNRMIGLMKEGEERSNVPLGVCNKIICERGLLTTYHCSKGVIGTETGACRTVPHDTLPYPDCCQNFVCD